MDSIFKSFKNLNEGVLRSLICTVELLTYTNLITQLRKNASSRVTKVINKNRSTKLNEDYMMQKNNELMAELNKLKKPELMLRLIMSIEDRLRPAYDLSKEKFNLSLLEDVMLSSAAKKYKIGKSLSSEEITKAIKIEVEKEMKGIKLKDSDLDRQKEKEMEDAIDEEIKNLTPEEEQELKEQLNIDELSGTAIKELLTKTGGALTLMMIPTLAGFSSYIALTTIMHAVFTTVLGITLPFAAYTGATTFMSILSGPVGWIGISGVTMYTLNKNKDKLTQAVMAQVVGITAIFSESIEDHNSLLPSWLTINKQKELIDIKAKLDAEQKEVERLLIVKEELENNRIKASEETVFLQREIVNLTTLLNNTQEESEGRAELLNIIEDREEQLAIYKEAEGKAKQIVTAIATKNENIKGYVELIAQYLMAPKAKDKKGALGEIDVLNSIIENVSADTFVLPQPVLGERSPDFLIIHPIHGFRLIEVKNLFLGNISHIESNGFLKIVLNGKENRMNPIKQVKTHLDQLHSYLGNNYPELGDQFRNIGYCVINVGYTKQEFCAKFSETLNRWDSQTRNEYFKYNMFKDDLDSNDFEAKLWGAKKFTQIFLPLDQETIKRIAYSTGIDPYFK